ncbi:hypothetical protein MPRM_14950 [Mycobacterium parmense]|uniref:Uncharacterized protein n=1 Tax=Mycobacterium parmense TaxID=185642 RepID=A0A7I7YSU1_9MYCO|nr:hypothetical protein MPRM_14950 [Mycobacterium parmense]
MVGSAGEGEVVDVGGVAFGPVGDVVDFAVVAADGAAGRGAAAILAVEHDSLGGGGQAFGVVQRQGFAPVEDRQVVMGMAGQADHVGHWQPRAAAGEAAPGGGFEFGQGGGDDDAGR